MKSKSAAAAAAAAATPTIKLLPCCTCHANRHEAMSCFGFMHDFDMYDRNFMKYSCIDPEAELR